MNLSYNPLLKKYKSVTGAVEVGKPFTICVFSNADSVSLMIRKEGDWESLVSYVMKKAENCFFVEMNITTPGLYRYFFKAETTAKTQEFYADADLLSSKEGERWVLLAYEQKYDAPNWLLGGTMYQIFPDRFAIGGKRLKTKPTMVYREDWDGVPYYKPNAKGIVENRDMFGGNLDGITEKLDYLLSLGVTCVYVNPIFEAASNHKYDTGSYRRVDSDFGGVRSLHRLLEEADKRGISVILDGVFSHTGADSVYFNKYGTYDSVGAFNSKDSPYYDWYKFEKYPESYECWWGMKIQPNVDEDNPDYNEFINGEDGIVRSYIRMGTAGWRLDVADELPDKFLTNLTRSAKKEKKDAIVLGEVWENAATKCAYGHLRRYLWGGQLDSVTNYPIKEAILSFVKDGNPIGLKRTMNMLVNDYPARNLNLLMNVIDTHDTPRALTLLGDYGKLEGREQRADAKSLDLDVAKNKLRLAACLQFFLPGIPCVYYGDEAGMEGFEDPFNRKCYPWGREDNGLVEFYKRLGEIRNRHKNVLSDGEYSLVLAEKELFVFNRVKDGKTITVAVNAGGKAVELSDAKIDLISGNELQNLQAMTCAVFCGEITVKN